MSLILIDKHNIPMIKQSNVTEKNVEKILVKMPYGMVIVVNENKQLLGYYDVANWNGGKDLEGAMQAIPYWRSVSEIGPDELGKYALYPIVDANNKVIKIFYETEARNDDSSKQLARLMEMQQISYNFKHYLDKVKCSKKRIAIFTDYHRINASLQLGEIFCNAGSDIKFEGVFIYSGFKKLVTHNTYNLNCQLIFIDSLSEMVDRGVQVIYFNAESYAKASRINYFKKAKIECKDVDIALKLMNNTCLTDYSIIKFKKELKDKGIDFLTMAVPRSVDMGQTNRVHTLEALKQFLKSNMDEKQAEELYEVRSNFIKNMVKDGEMRYYKDISSTLFNVISKCRYVPGQPAEYTRTVYLVGPCIVAGLYVKDEDTLGGQLQAFYNENNEPVRIVALPVSTESHREYYMKTIMSLQPEKGDTVVFVDQTFRFLRYDMDCIEECRQAVETYGRDIYYDIPSHCNRVLMKTIAKKLYDGLHNNDYDYSKYEKDYSKYITRTEEKMAYVDSLSNNSELAEYKKFIRSNALSKKVVNGAIVMNCNPFTKGHLYLIEYAASQVDYLYIFAVQEDKSYFKFEDRIALMKKGTAHLPNVRIFPSGKFIISSTTFSEYFDKANLSGTTVDTSMDVEIFGKHIAPALDISVRFVGQEPLDPITNQYNQSLKRILPKYGIELREIPRKESDGQVISASRVRKCLEEQRWKEIKEIVPQTTYDFLYEKFYKK